MSSWWRLRAAAASLMLAVSLGCGEGPTIDEGSIAPLNTQPRQSEVPKGGLPVQPSGQSGQEQPVVEDKPEQATGSGADSSRTPVVRLPRAPITTVPPQDDDPEVPPPASGGVPPEDTPEEPPPEDDPPAQVGDWHTQKAEAWRPLLEKYFQPKDMTWAINVINCESGGNPDALNEGSGASGLFQHLARFWEGRSKAAGWEGADIFDPEANIAVGAHLYYNGGPQHWSCKG